MKLIFTISILLLFSIKSYAQAWQPCGLNPNGNSTANTSLCIHKGKLFASNNKGIFVSTDNGQSFQHIDSTILIASKMISAGNRLYVITSLLGCSEIIYTDDEFQTYSQDTLGLPACSWPPEKRPNAGGKAWTDHIVLSLAGPDWEWSKHVNDSAWTDITYFDPNDPGDFFVKNDTCWATTNGSTSNGVAWSTDGVNWTSPTCAGIPGFYVPVQMAIIGNRIIMNGSDVGAGAAGVDTILKYSDDYGATFQEINIKQYLDTFAFFSFTGKQPILDMYVGYNKLYLALGQDVLETAPELIVSSDNGMTFQKDTLGFPNNVLGTVFEINDMAFNNGWAFAQVNSGDIYRKQVGPNSLNELKSTSFNVYPNPASNSISFEKFWNTPTVKVSIYNFLGQEVLSKFSNENSLNIDDLTTGNYLLKIQDNKNIYLSKFIKK